MPRAASVLAALMSSMLAACSTTVGPVSDPKELQWLEFLQASTVSRQEIERRMGLPGAAYENGRVVTYCVGRLGDQFWVIPGVGKCGDYTLVVVYRMDDTLDRWSLVSRARSQ